MPPSPPVPADPVRLKASALRFVVVIGVVSLFSDMTYEGARSVNGPYLAVLGATATAVGVISGLGELIGYLIRLLSGWAAGRTGRYWLWTGSGYVVNLLAVPALALAGSWEIAAGLIVAERIGKGLRNPPRDAMLSHAGTVIGQGWAFALREALDQTGALVGPLAIALILFLRGSYPLAYAWLLVPAVLSLISLGVGRWLFPRPQLLEVRSRSTGGSRSLPRAYWLYLVAMALVALGYADFNLVSYHLEKVGDPSSAIPLLYALAMGTAGLSALVFVRWLDRAGLPVLMFAVLLSAVFAPPAFLGGLAAAVVGVGLWGVGMGIQDSLMSAPIASMIHADGRANAFGIFNAVYGSAWFVGSAALGVLYDHAIVALVAFSVVAQVAAVGVLLASRRGIESSASAGG